MSKSSPSPYHHGDLKEALLREAQAVLAEEGEEALSLRGLARRLGVSSGAPYRHYPDRDALLRAVVIRGFDDLAARAARADAAAPSGEAVGAQAIAYVRFAEENPALLRLMFSPLRFHPDVAATAEAAFAVLVGRMRRDWPDDARQEARLLAAWALMHGLAILTVDGQLADKGAPEGVVTAIFRAVALSC